MYGRLVLTAVLFVAGLGALAFTVVRLAFPPGPPVRHDLERIVAAVPGASAYASGSHGAWASVPESRRRLGTTAGLYTAALVLELVDEGRLKLTPPMRTLLASREPASYARLVRIASDAAEELPAALYFERIVQPLELHATSWDPQRGVVASARDLGRFATSLMQGQALDARRVRQMEHGAVWRSPEKTGCDDGAFGWFGERAGVLVRADGKRVAVLLGSGAALRATVRKLYCAA